MFSGIMSNQAIKISLLIVLLSVAAVVAAVRVMPYINSPRKTKTSTTVYARVIGQDYSEDKLREGADKLATGLNSRVTEVLHNLPADQRPTKDQRIQIAASITGFVVLSRTASRAQWVEHYQSLGLDPPAQMVKEDLAISDKIWSHSTPWARHAEIDPSEIRVEPLYRNYTTIQDLPQVFGMYRARPFYSQKNDPSQNSRRFSAYEIFIPVIVPTIDAKDEYPLELGLIVLNDGPDGQWSVARTRFTGLPNGAICYVPYP